MPVVSQSIIRPIVPVGASTLACELRTPCSSPSRTAASHDSWPAASSSAGTASAPSISWLASRCIRSTAQHVLLVLGEAGERAHPAGRAGARGVGVAGHQRRDRRGPGPAVGRVVGQAERHQQRAEVGVAEAELAEVAARLGDLRRRVVGPADEDLLGREHDLDGVAEGVDVEVAVGVEVLEQVDRGEIAGAVVEVHVLTAIPNNHAICNIGVVPRLAQIVGELDAVLDPFDQMDRRVGVVNRRDRDRRRSSAAARPCAAGRSRSRRRSASTRRTRDAQVVGRPALVRDGRTVLALGT